MTYTMRVSADTAQLIEIVKSTIEDYEKPLKSKFYCEDKVDENGCIVIVCHWVDNVPEFGQKPFSITIALSDFSLEMDRDQLLLTYKLLSY